MTALFWMLKPQDQVALMQYQYDHYDTHLDIPMDAFKSVSLDSQIETLEEIDREMRKAPSRSRRD